MSKKILSIFALFLLFIAGIASVSALGETVYIGDYQISYTYFSADEGDRFTLTVVVTNTGELKEDVVLEINDNTPFDVNEDKWEIGNLAKDETKSKSFRVDIDEDTPQGNYNLEFNIEDKKEDFDDEFNIEVSSKKADLIIGSINSLPSTLSPDTKDVKLDITLENLGGGDANFVKARLILPEGFSSSSSFSDFVNLGTLASGSDKTAAFYVDISKEVASGNHKAKIELAYRTDNDDKISLLDFEIPIKGKPQFQVTGSKTSPGSVPAGASGTLSITIKNTGEEKGEETSVRIFENADFPITFDEKTSFIGTVEKGKTGTATFKFDVDSDGNPNSYLVRLQVRTLQNNNILVEEHTVPVKIVEGQQGISGYLIIAIIIIAALIVIYIIYRLLKPKKAGKKER
ncbi:hypothetical protein A3K73_05270 [Candidatus Pacearchaeota archaeon RBG_13_36_9]|nr:MAG: hypothetical protein A3K73_05270 [Candidatus Pacearchaeota archaeon RBG_13_36_9]